MENPFLRLFVENTYDDPLIHMHEAFIEVLRNSTWYSCENNGMPKLEKNELSRLASGMIYYISTRSNILYANEQNLCSQVIQCRIGIFDLATLYSSDFINESMNANPEDSSLNVLRKRRNRASAALLFHYKYCCIHEKLFLVSWLKRWIEISIQVDKVLGRTECELQTLFLALKKMESWTDEIEETFETRKMGKL